MSMRELRHLRLVFAWGFAFKLRRNGLRLAYQAPQVSDIPLYLLRAEIHS